MDAGWEMFPAVGIDEWNAVDKKGWRMDDTGRLDRILAGGYCGKILHGNAGRELKLRVMESIERFQEFEKTGTPVISYVAAWRDENRIWYEYAAERFAGLFSCARHELADLLRKRIVERRIYRYGERESSISKEIRSAPSLTGVRKSLRHQGEETGLIEAVYKIRTEQGGVLWLKDQAAVERFDHDGITLSLGHLTVVTKEMEAEEERAKLLTRLEEALMRVRILSGLLPICSSCKKVKDDRGAWRQIEDYIGENSEASFSHGYCPECYERAKEELERLDIGGE